MSATLIIGRLELGPPSSATQELMGDPVGQIGSAVVAAPRVPLQVTLDINTILSGAATLAEAQTLRRQIRSALNNGPLKFQMFLYVQYSDDPEQNGWLVPGPMTLASPDATAWKAVGLWQSQSAVWYLAGRRWTMKEARSVWMKDLRSGGFDRDLLGWLSSTDFAVLPALALTYLPNGATVISEGLSDSGVAGIAMPEGRDGGVCQLVTGAVDLSVLTFNRPESALNVSDVIAYDRRGHIGPFGVGGAYDTTAGLADPQSAYGWEEVYGPDYPWSWTTEGGTSDAPCVENGLVRVRFGLTDGISAKPGFWVDVWNGSTYVTQGKMHISRTIGSGGSDDTWNHAELYEYTPDRAVIFCALGRSNDPTAHDRMFVTIQRGEMTVTFEAYPSLQADGITPNDGRLTWELVTAANESVMKIDAQGTGVDASWVPSPPATTQNTGSTPAKIVATAGTGSPTFSAAIVGALSFTSSENWAAVLPCITDYKTPGPFQTSLAVVQAANAGLRTDPNSVGGYSANQAGYLKCRVGFAPTQVDQVLEAENMSAGSGTSVVTDTGASGGATNNSTSATRTSDAVHVQTAVWPGVGGTATGTYRLFARVRVSASTGHFYAKTTSGTGVTVTATSTSYIWVDLGELDTNTGFLEIHAWLSAAGTVFVDRIEAFLVEDRTRTGAQYLGARDVGQATLYDSRTIGALTVR